MTTYIKPSSSHQVLSHKDTKSPCLREGSLTTVSRSLCKDGDEVRFELRAVWFQAWGLSCVFPSRIQAPRSSPFLYL